MQDNTAPAQPSETNQPTNQPSEMPSEAPSVPEKAVEPQNTVQEPNPNTITLTDEQKRFLDSNGGMDKVFTRMKEAISRPQERPFQQKEIAEQEKATQYQPQQPQQQERVAIPKGYITPQEYMTEQYFKSLSNEEKYSGISEQIRSGEVLKEMAEFGIQPTNADGLFNDGQVRRFLDLKAQTVPAQTPATPITDIPTANWVDVGEQIGSMDDARKILSQNMGMPGQEHPMTTQAKEFIKNYYKR